MLIFEKMNNLFVEVEGILIFAEKKILNRVGLIPFVGAFTFIIRALIGMVQLYAGFLFGLVFGIAAFIQDKNGNSEEAEKSYGIAGRGLRHIVHAVANVARGFIEVFPFLPLITALPYDLSGARIRYTVETAQQPESAS